MPPHRGQLRPAHHFHIPVQTIHPTPKPTDRELLRHQVRQRVQTEPFNPLIDRLDREIPMRTRPNAPMPYIETLLQKEPKLVKEFMQQAEKMGIDSKEMIEIVADEVRRRLAIRRGYLD